MLNNSGINKVFLVGHIGKEPRRHNMEGQVEILCFPLVTNEFIKKNGESIEHVEWHQIKVQANMLSPGQCGQLCKGQLLYVEGKIHTRNFVDEMNIKRYKTEIIVNRLEFMGVLKPVLV